MFGQQYQKSFLCNIFKKVDRIMESFQQNDIKLFIIYNILFRNIMFLEADDNLPRSEDQSKIVYIYENSCNNRDPIQYRIKNQHMVFKDIARILKFKKLRLFNEEGAQYFQDDIQFVKNRTSLYASKGEEFDPHNCFGQYEILNKLGQGGFGQVFLANHRHTGQKCAIKIIKISSVSDIDSIFVEAEILKSLKHENIVKVTNCLTLKNMQVAIIMEYLEGGQLLNYVQKQGKLDEKTCKIFLRQIVKGIMYCHDNYLIHRDLKLENILLVNSQEKKIKIIDFGIAGVMSKLTQEDLDTGSLGYMAPQCFNAAVNVKFDGRMDIWSIGVILFSMLVGQLPFKGQNTQEIKQNIKKCNYKLPVEIKKSISKDCLNVIFRCLDPNPKTRIKIGQLMIHDWFSRETNQVKSDLEPVIEKKYTGVSLLGPLTQITSHNKIVIEEKPSRDHTKSTYSMKRQKDSKKSVSKKEVNDLRGPLRQRVLLTKL